ncbi:MAG: DEAD/DEAH box helicase [Lachnospiraceae bacterium]|nr:DEAD/DEAH box helicase [Lachnospiraceae bacterium]
MNTGKACIKKNQNQMKSPFRVIFTEETFRVDKGEKPTIEAHKKLYEEFLRNRYKALFYFGFGERIADLSPSAAFLYLFSEQFLKSLTAHSELEIARENIQIEPEADTVEYLLKAVPFGLGTEYLTEKWIRGMYQRLTRIYSYEISQYEGTAALFLAERSQHLKVPERIFFHLVENGKESDYPFAFLATYATKDEHGNVRHMPLQYALTEYKNQREKLLELLSCLNQAAEGSELISDFVERGEMFHPLRLTAAEAYEILKAIPVIEEAGILCRIPNWWKKKYASPSLSVSLGDKKPALLGFETLISVQPKLQVDGIALTKKEIKELLAQTEGLAWLKGRWVEVNHAKLQKLLEEMEEYPETVTLREALRMGAGSFEEDSFEMEESKVTNGLWLSNLLRNLRTPVSIRQAAVPKSFRAVLRPYQKTGYTWLTYMSKLGFGACLADDMGLGKTIQVLAFLEKRRKECPEDKILLVVPASLIGNWRKETEKFAPSMSIKILHGKTTAQLTEELIKKQDESTAFLNITTYGMINRLTILQEIQWDVVILDEAQAIKNPGTRQTRAVKKLKTKNRIAMTGTPIENDLTNLWSLFDFLNPGLMGNGREFKDFTKQLGEHPEGYGKLKNMVAPFLLRRLKSDKNIISDLPEKLEQVDYVGLSKKQIVLYRKQVVELERKISEVDGKERRGLVLKVLTKLKQICNHPDQFLGQETFDPEESGKFQLLGELCETIYEKRERVLVFTQYREMTKPLADYLEQIMGRKGLILHGGTRVTKRAELVDTFNGEEYVPYMVLSLKAAGTGLNLTRANHVIHFDRWWNPAVEDQATDRAYRIGQEKNVLVHKLVSEGTIEEKIDEMIQSKKELADQIIGAGGEKWITEMDNDQILSMLRLDA